MLFAFYSFPELGNCKWYQFLKNSLLCDNFLSLTDEMNNVDEWTRAVQQVDLDTVYALYNQDASILWKPLSGWDPERDAAHVIEQLKTVQSLGASLDNLCALQYILLQYSEPKVDEQLTDAQRQTAQLLSFLIEVLGVI